MENNNEEKHATWNEFSFRDIPCSTRWRLLLRHLAWGHQSWPVSLQESRRKIKAWTTITSYRRLRVLALQNILHATKEVGLTKNLQKLHDMVRGPLGRLCMMMNSLMLQLPGGHLEKKLLDMLSTRNPHRLRICRHTSGNIEWIIFTHAMKAIRVMLRLWQWIQRENESPSLIYGTDA